MPAAAGPLLDQLRREANATIAERVASARAEAAEIRDRAAARREQRRGETLDARQRALAAKRESARAEAAEATRSRVLTARDAFLGRVFAETEGHLNALADASDLPQRLVPLLAEALPYVEGDGAHALCAERVRSAVSAGLALLGRAELPIERDDTVPPGAVLANRDGSVRVVATLVARMERLRPLLAIEAVGVIEREGEFP